MRRFAGALFIAVGVVFLYLFAVLGAFHAGEAAFDEKVPFQTLGHHYPKDVLYLLGAAWGLLVGLVLILKGEPEPPPAPAAAGDRGAAQARLVAMSQTGGGRIALFHLLNACLVVSSLFVAYIGAKSGAELKLVGVFFATGLLGIGLGLLLMVLALFEKPKGVISLLLGSAVYISGVAAGVLAFLWGMPK